MVRNFDFIIIWSIVLAYCVPALHAQSQNEEPLVAHRALIDDYDYFIRQLETIHPDPYSVYGGVADFRKKTDSLRLILEEDQSLNAESLQRQISRFLIPLHDGHTYCGYMNLGSEQDNRYLPIDFHATCEGFYVGGGAKTYESLIGAQLKKVGGLSIRELLDRIALLAEHEHCLLGVKLYPDIAPSR